MQAGKAVERVVGIMDLAVQLECLGEVGIMQRGEQFSDTDM